jgi:hypothetical protein
MKTLTITIIFTTFALLINLCINNFCWQDLFTLIKGWQTLIAAIIVIIGWFVNSKLNRNAEIAKRRLEYRLTALKSVVEDILFEISKGANNAFTQPDFKNRLEKARATIQMYGYRKEIDIYEEFIAAINLVANTDAEKQNKLNKINECMSKLTIILESLRTELGLENYKRQK